MKKLMFYMLLTGAAVAQAAEPARAKLPLLDVEHVLAVLVYSVIGIVVMVLSFAIIDWVHPRDIWGEIADKQNRAMAIVFGCMMLGIAIIIAAAIVG